MRSAVVFCLAAVMAADATRLGGTVGANGGVGLGNRAVGGNGAGGGRLSSTAGHAPPEPMPSPPTVAPDAFVRVTGHRFMLGGQPFHFVGANMAIMHGPEARAAATAVLTAAAADGVRVGRIWALGEGERDAPPWLRDNFLFRAGPDGWVEAATDHLDRVIAEAGRLGVRLIVTLANSWGDYGGVPRYLGWTRSVRAGVYGSADIFYSEPRARAEYRAHVARLLSRTNHITGVPYRDDPTILGWELMNESTVATAAGVIARRAWVVEMARFIHAADPNHLVTPGIGGYRLERERLDWLAVCRLPGVDFCDGHLYPEDLLGDRDSGVIDASLDEYVRLAHAFAGKPFVLGEFGLRGDGPPRWRGHSRVWWVAHILERLRFDGAAGGLIWIYQGAHGTDGVHGISVDEAGGTDGASAGVDPRQETIRGAIRGAAAALISAGKDGGGTPPNPHIDAGPDQAPLMPLHAEFAGRRAAVPLATTDGGRDGSPLSFTWDPPAYARGDWETAGVYRGGALEHAWGGEVGWFEYEYEIVVGRGDVTARRVRTDSAVVAVSARVSSEYPGTLSPPDGASLFQVFLDGALLGGGVAPRDDGRGDTVTVRARGRDLGIGNPLAPGRHRLRFAVARGARAHGLAVYGRAGVKPIPGVDVGRVELRFSWPRSRTKHAAAVSPPPTAP